MSVAEMSQAEYDQYAKRRDIEERRLYIAGGFVAVFLFLLAAAL